MGVGRGDTLVEDHRFTEVESVWCHDHCALLWTSVQVIMFLPLLFGKRFGFGLNLAVVTIFWIERL